MYRGRHWVEPRAGWRTLGPVIWGRLGRWLDWGRHWLGQRSLTASRCSSKAVTLTRKSLTSARISSKSCTTSWRVEGTPAWDTGTARSAPYCSSIVHHGLPQCHNWSLESRWW
ncbi:uncharacterized protein LOC123509059 [Portunus trituberculatus]|uniref:uncharacterized protein LOC123509059 n=1 Tax=Portunus trituberculatus TaxID=210409 RepID=UPI001E1CE86F|nr:uncharacterized protein LOC123509059 [Portunus trituberculatus]